MSIKTSIYSILFVVVIFIFSFFIFYWNQKWIKAGREDRHVQQTPIFKSTYKYHISISNWVCKEKRSFSLLTWINISSHMCHRVTCSICSKPTWAGCGMHIESALGKWAYYTDVYKYYYTVGIIYLVPNFELLLRVVLHTLIYFIHILGLFLTAGVPVDQRCKCPRTAGACTISWNLSRPLSQLNLFYWNVFLSFNYEMIIKNSVVLFY